jgi:hypothetical protein
VAGRPSHAFVPLHHASPFRTAASAAILHKGLNLLELLRCEHTPSGEQRFHVLLLHLSALGIHFIQLLHDCIMIRIIRAQQLTEFNVAQFQFRASLHGSLLRVYAKRVQAPNLLIGETKILSHAWIFRHAQKVLAATKFVPSAVLPTTGSAFSRPAERARAASREFMRALTPFVLSVATKLMLALPKTGALWRPILSPRDNRSRQQNHKP